MAFHKKDVDQRGQSGHATPGVVCCHFMQFGDCSHGAECKFVHASRDPATTLCGYGQDCKYWHGYPSAETWQPKEQKTWRQKDNSKQSAGWAWQQGWEATCEETSEPEEEGGKTRSGSEESNTVSACCQFLEFGDCRKGDECKFEHAQSDAKDTICRFGKNCKHGHGWAARPPLRKQSEKNSGYDSTNAWKASSKETWKNSGHGSTSAWKADYTREVCCSYLEWGSCHKENSCPYEHVRGRPANTVCAFGKQCRHGHGWARQEGHTGNATKSSWNADGTQKSNAQPKLIKAALNSLLGWWHSKDSNNQMQTHEIAMNLAADRQGSAEISCYTADRNGTQSCEAVRFDGGDIVLGKNGKYFLDVSTDTFASWINANDPLDKCKWTRGWADLGCGHKNKNKKQNTDGAAQEEAADAPKEVSGGAEHVKFQ